MSDIAISPSQDMTVRHPLRENLVWAWNGAKSVADRAKSSSTIVKFGLDSVEKLSQPVVERVVALGDPLVTRVDQYFVGKDVRTSTHIVESSWFKQVDDILCFQHFYKVATEQFRFLDKGDGNVPRDEFLTGLKAKLFNFWDDGFWLIGDAFLTKVRTALRDLGTSTGTSQSDVFSKIQTQFREVWESKINATFQSAVVSPATYVYVAALDQYLAFDLDNRKVTAKAFLAGMKSRLGNSWDENLNKPLREFLTGARKAAVGDLIRIRAAIDSDLLCSLTLGDVIDSTSKAVTPVVSTTSGLVDGTWRGLLQVTQNSFDFFLPEQVVEQVEEKLPREIESAHPITLRSLSTHVSRRLKSKAEASLHKVRKFSAERLKNLIHIDLIAYAEEVIDKQKSLATPHLEHAQSFLQQALLNVRQSLDDARSAVSEAIPKTKVGVRSVAVREKMKPFTRNLRNKLKEAIRRAKDLGAHGKDHILHQQLVKLPGDTVKFFLQLPFALQVLWAQDKLRSPELPVAIEKVQGLLIAIRDVFACLVLIDAPTKAQIRESKEVQKLVEIELQNVAAHSKEGSDEAPVTDSKQTEVGPQSPKEPTSPQPTSPQPSPKELTEESSEEGDEDIYEHEADQGK